MGKLNYVSQIIEFAKNLRYNKMMLIIKQQEEFVMGDFLMCVAHYLIIMVILAAIGCAGGFIGVKLRKSKDAKKAAVKEETVSVEE